MIEFIQCFLLLIFLLTTVIVVFKGIKDKIISIKDILFTIIVMIVVFLFLMKAGY